MNKIKLLTPVVSALAVSSVIVPLTSCSTQETTIKPNINVEQGEAVVSEIQLNKSFSVAYSPKSGYALKAITIKIGSSTLKESTDFILSGNIAFVKGDVVTDSSITITITAQSIEEEFTWEKENTYFCEQQLINTEHNAISHNVRFQLKSALTGNQKLTAKIVEDQEGTAIIKSEEKTLDDFIFANDFFVPVSYYTDYVETTAITKMSIEITCKDGSNVVWTNKYKNIYIKFNALNAFAGEDYRGYTCDYTHMDNYPYTHIFWSTETSGKSADVVAKAKYAFPFPIRLRNQITEGSLHAVVYNPVVHEPSGAVLSNWTIRLCDQDDDYNWFKWGWNSTDNRYDYGLAQTYGSAIYEPSDPQYKLAREVFMTFAKKGATATDLVHKSYGTFELLVYHTNADGSLSWYENFSGCKMVYVDPDTDNN